MEKLTNDQIILKINDFKKSREDYYQKLNDHAIWLFLATLACWSVSNHIIRYIALVIVLVFFAIDVIEGTKDKRFNDEIIKDLVRDIKSSLDGDAKDARLYQIEKIKKEVLSYKNFIIKTQRFMISFLYWAGSILLLSICKF